MARGKKAEKVLTPEEKLEQALVPVEEQPYPVPENWCWVNIGSINHYNGCAVNPENAPDALFELYSVPSSAMNYPEILTGSEIGSSKQSVEKNDVLLCKINPRINRVWKVYKYTDYDLVVSSEWIVIRNQYINSDYLMYCLKSQYFREFMLSNVSGVGGSLMRAQPKFVKNYPIPIAPLEEQQRIVERIKSLFSKLDEAKEKVQAVLDGFETRKAVILHKAFIGELTAKWRKENNIALDSWCWKTIDEVCFDIKVGIVIKPSQYYTDNIHGTPAFRSANVRENYVDNFDWVYLNDKGMKANHRSIVHTGDVLIVRSGNPGTACVVTEEFDGYNAIDILIAVPNPEIVLPEYLCLFTNSPLGKKTIAEGKRGMALAHFNVKSYSKVDICLPMLNEQKEIIDLFQRLLLNEQEVKKTTESVLDQIETMKKSILARAFRGELGTNDLSEECMAKLLENML